MAFFTNKCVSTNRYLLNNSNQIQSLDLYDNTHSVLIYNEGAESIYILFGNQNFGANNFHTLTSGNYGAFEVGIAEMNPQQREVKLKIADSSNSSYVRIHQLVGSKR